MRPIDADALIQTIRKEGVYRSGIPGNWWNGMPRDLSVKEIEKIIREQPTIVPPPERARIPDGDSENREERP